MHILEKVKGDMRNYQYDMKFDKIEISLYERGVVRHTTACLMNVFSNRLSSGEPAPASALCPSSEKVGAGA